MKCHLYYLPPFKTFGVGWLILREDDIFRLYNDYPTIHTLNDFNEKDSINQLVDIIDNGENPQLELVDVTLEEIQAYINMYALLE